MLGELNITPTLRRGCWFTKLTRCGFQGAFSAALVNMGLSDRYGFGKVGERTSDNT